MEVQLMAAARQGVLDCIEKQEFSSTATVNRFFK
jgi:hypothetical protein